jgi:hypothetical protein
MFHAMQCVHRHEEAVPVVLAAGGVVKLTQVKMTLAVAHRLVEFPVYSKDNLIEKIMLEIAE